MTLMELYDLKRNKHSGMTFSDLIDTEPNVRVCDIIQLFLLGQNDKIYLNLKIVGPRYDEKYLLKDERIIHDEWQPYYECKVMRIEEECTEGTGLGYLTLVI